MQHENYFCYIIRIDRIRSGKCKISIVERYCFENKDKV